MSDEIEEQFDLYKQRSLSRAFKINQLNKKINAKTDLILRFKQQLKQKDKRIDELQKALDIAIEAVEFYGDVNNWSYQQIIDDISEINGSLEGGKKARQAKQQIDEILKGEGDE